MTSTARNRTRVVLHVDLDAFYCKQGRYRLYFCHCLLLVCSLPNRCVTGQVEMKRVGIPAHVPCAVQQWEGLIAGDIFCLICILTYAKRLWKSSVLVLYSRQVSCSLLRCVQLLGWHAAVNYPARAAGITRHMRRAEAKAKCPELQCVHVETIGGFNAMCRCNTDRNVVLSASMLQTTSFNAIIVPHTSPTNIQHSHHAWPSLAPCSIHA